MGTNEAAVMTITHHCDDCGMQVDESCPEHPSADIVSVATRTEPKAPDASSGIADAMARKRADREAELLRDEQSRAARGTDYAISQLGGRS